MLAGASGEGGPEGSVEGERVDKGSGAARDILGTAEVRTQSQRWRAKAVAGDQGRVVQNREWVSAWMLDQAAGSEPRLCSSPPVQH